MQVSVEATVTSTIARHGGGEGGAIALPQILNIYIGNHFLLKVRISYTICVAPNQILLARACFLLISLLSEFPHFHSGVATGIVLINHLLSNC